MRTLFCYKSPLGTLSCLFEEEVLIDLSIKEIPLQYKNASLHVLPKGHLFARELDRYFRGELREFTQPFAFIQGTRFEHKVWSALQEIPFGEVRTYKWIAERVGSPKATRAAGQALKKNPLPIILPCHRVISSDGSPGGFSCGVEIKKWLLDHERQHH